MTTPHARTGRRARRALTGLVLLTLVVAGCTGGESGDETSDESATAATPESPTPTEPDPTDAGRGLERFYSQQVDWQPCDGDFECGIVEVPVDYDEPTGKTLGLAVNRLPAEGGPATGSLVVNPGGPGASGVEYAPQAAAQLGPEVLAGYDVVGFDPRGVGASEPVECFDDAGVDRLLATDPDPDTAQEASDTEDLLEEFASGCVDDAGALLPHLSTVDVARDLDVLRSVLGDERLTYYGASYGTYIGAVYAELFPEQVGRLVLDGAVDPSLDSEELNQQQAAGFETALRAYVSNCVAQPDCPLGSDVERGVRRVQDFLAELDANPLPTGTDRELTEALGLYGIALPLYVKSYWSLLDQALTQAFDGNGATLLALADAYWRRTDTGYTGNMAQAIYAVNCLDHPVRTTGAEIRDSIPEYEQAAPTFGRSFAWSVLACALWPVDAADPVPEVDGEGAAPILVVGTTRDPATPYRWAQAMAKQLESGVLLTRDGDGHTGYAQGNDCIDSAVDAYLVDGEVPADGKRC